MRPISHILLLRPRLTILSHLLIHTFPAPLALPLVAEEVQNLLDPHELLPEVVVNDHKGEDVTAIYKDNKPIQQ